MTKLTTTSFLPTTPRPGLKHLLLALGLGAGITLASLPTHAADALPGQGITVVPLKSTIAEETFQTLLVMKGLERLGYTVEPIKETDYPAAHLAIASGDGTFMASHWDPLHADYFTNSGGEAKLWRENEYSTGALQGYLIDKKTADAYDITNLDDLKKPDIAALFDTDGDGKANLTGCNPGWGCEVVIEHHMDAYKLRDSVNHVQGNYSALIADTIARYKRGEPVLYYTWTPYWVSNVLKPGRDVVWLEVPFTALPGEQAGLDTKLPNGKNYGFVVNTQRILANRTFIEQNPAARRLFELMKLPVADINTQNMAMNDGQNKTADIERHADGWIKAHQAEFDGWVEQARAAAK